MQKKRMAPDDQIEILIAEDNLINQKLARAVIEKLFAGTGAKITVVDNGFKAFEQVIPDGKEGNKYKKFHFILMDDIMPERRGSEATASIREFEKEHAIHDKNFIITWSDTFKDETGRTIPFPGANAVVEKPLKPDELKNLLIQHSLLRMAPQETPSEVETETKKRTKQPLAKSGSTLFSNSNTQENPDQKPSHQEEIDAEKKLK